MKNCLKFNYILFFYFILVLSSTINTIQLNNQVINQNTNEKQTKLTKPVMNLKIQNNIITKDSKNLEYKMKKSDQLMQNPIFLETNHKNKNKNKNKGQKLESKAKNVNTLKISTKANFKDDDKLYYNNWLRRANITEFSQLKTLSDKEREQINPFEINKDFNPLDNKFDIPLKNLFYFELRQRGGLVMYNSKDTKDRLQIQNFDFKKVELLEKVTNIVYIFF